MKIAIVQPNYIIGALEGNYLKNITFLERAKQSECDLIIFPEMAVSGYPPLDLIDDKVFVDKQVGYANRLLGHSTEDLGIVCGIILPNHNPIGKPNFNAGVLAVDEEYKATAIKQLLPTYSIFDERRYFEPGKETCIAEHKGMKFGILICEDIWAEENNLYDTNPIEKLFRGDNKVDFIISINASPSDSNKLEVRRNMLERLSKKYNTSIIYVNQVGANDDIVFDGYSMIYNKGIRNFTMNGFEEDYREIIIEKDNKDILINSRHDINIPGSEGFCYMEETKGNAGIDNIHLYYKQIVLGIKDYVEKNGFEKVVIGESGGIDSALTTALAVDAIGVDNVIAITMPSDFSSEGSYKDSEILCNNLGVKLYIHPIKNIYNKYIGMFGEIFVEGIDKVGKLTRENIQARIRGNILMEYSNNFGALVLSTSNKSEASVGFCTIYGDTCGGLAPISDVYKCEVWELAKLYNHIHGDKELIPKVIIDKIPSAELAPNQKDSDSLPPYPILDAILKLYIERELLDKITIDKCRGLVYNIPHNEIERVLRMVDKAEFKRRQAPPTIRVHKRAFGAGRRLPIVQKFDRGGTI